MTDQPARTVERAREQAQAQGRDNTGSPRIAVMQPYFLPSIVYFHLVHAADIFVFFDDAQFVTKRFTHRNAMPLGDSELRFTVPLDGRSQNRRIDEIGLHPHEYPRWRAKFLKTLEMNFGPHDAIGELAELTGDADIGLARLAQRSVEWASRRSGLQAQFLRSSQLDYDRDADASGKIVSICEKLGARNYVNAAGGQSLYDRAVFERHGVNLSFAQSAGPAETFATRSILWLILTGEGDDIGQYAAGYDLVRGSSDER